jgi:hypothetical protein
MLYVRLWEYQENTMERTPNKPLFNKNHSLSFFFIIFWHVHTRVGGWKIRTNDLRFIKHGSQPIKLPLRDHWVLILMQILWWKFKWRRKFFFGMSLTLHFLCNFLHLKPWCKRRIDGSAKWQSTRIWEQLKINSSYVFFLHVIKKNNTCHFYKLGWKKFL